MKPDIQDAAFPADVELSLSRLLDLIRSVPQQLLGVIGPGTEVESNDAHASAVQQVSAWLYPSWYCADEREQQSVPAISPRGELVSALRVSVAAAARWQTGWVAMQCAPNGTCVAGNCKQMRQLRPGQYANMARPGLPLAPGDSIAVNELLDWIDLQTGFWHVHSSVGEPLHPLVRAYWNVGWEHVGFVLEGISAALDTMKMKYALKCPFRAADFGRVDSLVVYLERDCWPRAAEPLIQELARELSGRLRPSIPPLTLQIASGVAFAEDPGGGISFGESRCRALASGVLALLRKPLGWNDDEGLITLMNALRAAGVDPRRPWWNSSA